MAADSRAYSGNRDHVGSKVKIQRLPDGTLVGASSTIVGGNEQVRKWYRDGADPNATLCDSFELLVVNPDGTVLLAKDKPLLSGPLHGEFFAIGSGSDLAMGAMACDRDAINAVIVACKFDPWSDIPIYAASHKGRMPKLRVLLPPDKFIWIKKEK